MALFVIGDGHRGILGGGEQAAVNGIMELPRKVKVTREGHPGQLFVLPMRKENLFIIIVIIIVIFLRPPATVAPDGSHPAL